MLKVAVNVPLHFKRNNMHVMYGFCDGKANSAVDGDGFWVNFRLVSILKYLSTFVRKGLFLSFSLPSEYPITQTADEEESHITVNM
jgi:hypothetical protein